MKNLMKNLIKILMTVFVLATVFSGFSMKNVEAEELPPVVEKTEYTVKPKGVIHIPYDNVNYTEISCELEDSYGTVKVLQDEGYIKISAPSKETETKLIIYTIYGEFTCDIHVKKVYAFDSDRYTVIRGEQLFISSEISDAKTWNNSNEDVLRLEKGSSESSRIVKALKPGTSVVSARNAEGETAYTTITVTSSDFTINGEVHPEIGVECGSELAKRLELPDEGGYSWDNCTYEVETPGYILVYKERDTLYVKGVELGTTNIIVTNSFGESVICKVRVFKDLTDLQIQLNGVTRYYLGSTYKVDYSYTPEDANNKIIATLRYSSDESYADVTEDGWVTPKKVGGVTLQVESVDCYAEDYEKVYISNPYFQKEEYSLYKYQTEQLILNGENEDTIYSSSNPEIVTVDENGMVTAISEGCATIVADTNGYTAETVIYVTNPSLNKTSVSIYPNETTDIDVIGGMGDVVWKSSDTGVVKVSEKGKLTPVNPGQATITATVSDEVLKCKVTVKKPYLSAKNVKLYPNGTKKLTVKGTNKTVNWSTSNKNIVKVSKEGKLIPVKPGKATITASVHGLKLKCNVTIKSPVISKTSKKLVARQTFKLKVTGAKGTVKWSSSNGKVATVNSSGKVTAKKVGEATITAKANGKKLKCKITVKKNQITYSVDTDPSSYSYGEPSIALKKAYYDGNKLKVELWVINNRMFYAQKFDWLRYKLYDSNGKVIASKKFTNVKLGIQPYSSKKITLTFSGSALKNKSAILNNGVGDDWSYYYTYLY